jgi:hypothetical protein
MGGDCIASITRAISVFSGRELPRGIDFRRHVAVQRLALVGLGTPDEQRVRRISAKRFETLTVKATTAQKPAASRKGAEMAILPPAHPTSQLLDIIRYALAEDAGDRGFLPFKCLLIFN